MSKEKKLTQIENGRIKKIIRIARPKIEISFEGFLDIMIVYNATVIIVNDSLQCARYNGRDEFSIKL